MTRIVHFAAVLLLILTLVSAVAGQPSSVLRIGIMPIADTLPLYVAIDHGHLAAEGIEVRLMPLWSGARIIEALAGGSLDLGLSATLSILQAAEQGLDLVIVQASSFVRTDAIPVSALMVLKDSGITSAPDLRGKIIGVNSLKSIAYLVTAEYLARGSVRPGQVTWHEVGFPQMPAALEQRRVHAVLVAEPFLTVLKDTDRARILSPAQEVMAGHSMSAYTALRSWHAANARVMEAFDRGYKKGVEDCIKNSDKARDILARNTNTPAGLAQKIGLHLYSRGVVPAELAGLQELAQRHRLLTKGVDINRILAPTAVLR